MPKRANLRPPGRCIFCGNLGLTREHMWADWLRDYIPRMMPDHTIGSTTIFPTHQKHTVKRRIGDPHSRRIKCVCRKCNNEWMSGLQERAKPYLVPMLKGRATKLGRNAQTALSAGMAVIVAVSEDVDPEMVAISQSDRSRIFSTFKPPSRWRIFIGAHRRETYGLYTHNVMTLGTEEEFERLAGELPETANTQTTTMCLGEHLVIHVMSSSGVWNILRRWKLDPRIAPVRRSAR